MSDSSQHTSTITCTAALRVWHFSAFHFGSVVVVQPCPNLICVMVMLMIHNSNVQIRHYSSNM